MQTSELAQLSGCVARRSRCRSQATPAVALRPHLEDRSELTGVAGVECKQGGTAGGWALWWGHAPRLGRPDALPQLGAASPAVLMRTVQRPFALRASSDRGASLAPAPAMFARPAHSSPSRLNRCSRLRSEVHRAKGQSVSKNHPSRSGRSASPFAHLLTRAGENRWRSAGRIARNVIGYRQVPSRRGQPGSNFFRLVDGSPRDAPID